MSIHNSNQSEIFFLKRLLLVSLLMAGILTYFIACSSGGSTRAFGSGDTDFLARGPVEVGNAGLFKEFLGEATDCCSDTGGTFSCGTKNVVSTVNNLVHGVFGGGCAGGPLGQDVLGLNCLFEAEKLLRASRCDNYNRGLQFEMYYNDDTQGVGFVYLDIRDNNRGKMAGTILFEGSVHVFSDPDRFIFYSHYAAFYPFVYDTTGQAWVDEDNPKYVGSALTVTGGAGQLLREGSRLKVQATNGSYGFDAGTNVLFEGSITVQDNVDYSSYYSY